MSPLPVATGDPIPPRPGDIILTRAIAWYDSGQLWRALAGIIASVAPFVMDYLTGQSPWTWRGFLSGIALGLFAWMGLKRAKSPDVVTGIASFDKANVAAAAVPPAGQKPGA